MLRYIPVTFTTKEELDFDFEKKPEAWFKPEDSECKDAYSYCKNIKTQNNFFQNLKTVIITLGSTVDESSWIVGNVKHAGFYRVNYDKNNWQLLIQQLKEDHTIIDSITKSQLIDDSFNLGRAEIIDQRVFLDLISYLVNETSIIPFSSGLTFYIIYSNFFFNKKPKKIF